MADLQYYETNTVKTEDMGQVVDEIMRIQYDKRRGFERRWYDNNFFDDGYHFRFLSRSENKIVDLSERQSIYAPMRAIPIASRQIRGVANLLTGQNFIPVVYPEQVSQIQFIDPREYQEALQEAKRIAKASGHWLEEEFKEQLIRQKLAFMSILTPKHSVSYMQIWPDAIKEKIITQVYDAFDIYLDGTLTEIYDSPYIIKAVPQFISQIKANEMFDKVQLEKINPDNRQASSDIKQAYLNAKYYQMGEIERAAKIILKEAFLKEYLNSANMARIARQKNGERILRDKKEGDQVIRQVFVAGNIWLKDSYLNLPDYPFVDLRYEPGPIYQVPFIERFIPQNKSLDLVVSRLERWINTMAGGAWLKRQGEQFEINNQAGGQVIEYQTTPPVQVNVVNAPPMLFNFIQLLQGFMEQQGVATSALNAIPKGVKAHAAIESLKETEYANLSIPVEQLKVTVKRIAEKFLDLADNYFIKPKTVYYLEKGEPQYFDIVGNTSVEKRKELRDPSLQLGNNVIPIKKDYKVEIEVQSGLGYTREAKKQAALQLGEYLLKLAELKMMPPEAVQKFIQALLETYQFGATSEIMETFQGFQPGEMSDEQLDKLKIALMEVMKDLRGSEVLPTSEQRIEEGKIATAQVMKDSGIMDQRQPEAEGKEPSKSISFKDLPPEGKAQLAAQAGIQLSADEIEAQEEEKRKEAKANATQQNRQKSNG
mgnify:CR=1 FL=1